MKLGNAAQSPGTGGEYGEMDSQSRGRLARLPEAGGDILSELVVAMEATQGTGCLERCFHVFPHAEGDELSPPIISPTSGYG